MENCVTVGAESEVVPDIMLAPGATDEVMNVQLASAV